MKEKKARTVDAFLPANRFQQFGNILHHHFLEVVIVSLDTFLFSIPAIAWILFTGYVPLFQENYLVAIVFVYGILTPLLGLLGLGFAGGMYFFKRLLFGEGTILRSDFFLGIKKNGKMFFRIFFGIGVLYLLLHMGVGAIHALNWNNTLQAIMSGLSYTLFFLLLFISFFMQTETVLFEGGFFSLLWSGMRFMFATLYKGIGIYVVVLLPFFLFEFIPYNAAAWIALAISVPFWFGLSPLLLTQFSNHVFDLSVNRTQYPQNYRRGLAKSEDEKTASGEK